MATATIPFIRVGGLVLASTLLLTACMTTDPYSGEDRTSKTARGAGIGALAGAAIGVLSGSDAEERRKRALIGAGVGALAGGAVGQYMDRQEAKLREELRGSGVSVTRVGNDLVLNMPGNITFPVNGYSVRSDFYPVLNSVTKVLQEYDRTYIDVIGHTDITGPHDFNMRLSRQRADSVGQYLQAQGINGTRVLTHGVGPDYPTATNDTADGRQQNRRVELVLRPITA
jgi:outer membrane protein OmpA-like peptidoglycan-associated protein